MDNRNLPHPRAHASSDSFDPWLLWIAFRKHWGWILPLGALLASCFGLMVWYSFTPTYEAVYLMEANRDYVLTQPFSSNARDLAKSERQLITNALVLSPVLSNPKLKSAFTPSDPSGFGVIDPLAPERVIRERLSVGNAGTDNLLTISYQHRDPDMAAAVCNAIAESYLQLRRQRDDERMGNVEQWLQGPIDQWKRNVEDLRSKVATLTKSASGYDPFKEQSPIESDTSKLAQVRSMLAGLEAEEAVLEARLAVLNKGAAADQDAVELTPDVFEVRRYMDQDPQVQRLQQKLADISAKIRNMEYREQQNLWANRYKSLKEDAVQAELELREAEATARVAAEKLIAELDRKKHASEEAQQVEQLKFQLVNLQAKRQAFQSDYEEEKSRLEKLGGETAEIFFAREDYAQAAEILKQLNQRLAIMKTERGRGASVNTVATATRPSWPIQEVPTRKIAMATLLGFILPFALAVVLEFRFKRLTDAVGLESRGYAPVVGEVARVPGGTRSSRGHRLFEESIDALRANLLFKIEDARIIVVTSAMSAEGKSSVASQLAISLAKANDTTVLLIDADLRSPDQHELFGISNEPGLCKLLAGKATLDQCIDTSLGDCVHVLTAGELHVNPHNLLTKRSVERLFSEVVERYRYVVVDTAPVLPASETLAVTAAGHATLLCAMRDISRADHVRRTQKRLDDSGANVIGTVFSGVPSQHYAYRYGDYRYAAQIE